MEICYILWSFTPFWYVVPIKIWQRALAAWRSGHRIRLKNEKTRVRIPYKVFFFKQFIFFSDDTRNGLQ
jgi:hypothetical protein